MPTSGHCCEDQWVGTLWSPPQRTLPCARPLPSPGWDPKEPWRKLGGPGLDHHLVSKVRIALPAVGSPCGGHQGRGGEAFHRLKWKNLRLWVSTNPITQRELPLPFFTYLLFLHFCTYTLLTK